MHPYEVTFRGHRRADYAPGARVGGPVVVQLARQLKDLMTNPIPGISVAPDENDAMVWQVMVSRTAAVITSPACVHSMTAGGLYVLLERCGALYTGPETAGLLSIANAA